MILYSEEFTSKFKESLQEACVDIFLASAFIKNDALKKISSAISSSVERVRVVSRWQKYDLLARASDLEVYEFCKDRGWEFGVDLRFHGKLYVIDKTKIFLGSANLTQNGLSLFSRGNNEFGTIVDADYVDLSKIDSFVTSEVVWLDDALYEQMSYEVNSAQDSSDPFHNVAWSKGLELSISKPVHNLWVEELLFCSPDKLLFPNLDNVAVRHDLELLSLSFDDISVENLKFAFRRTRVYSWINSLLARYGSINFGGVSSNLHRALMDNPLPYRRRIKDFVLVIFSWLTFLNNEFRLKKYNKTTVVSVTG
ncbi:hypothetical protein H2508_13805 [Parahaliea sp. F7430]|uniref:PLD phosphodiesterase domain-containing protein n=1 Tax=Sediminihaliea albiluteola TaxID=2758564 RepID=A0A7W2YKH5_9GAMM|nr:phospholipase D-like domain-containing protein [Sediminihaliea albiluteola]MBA6414185.1 hypothetical protein [Sediminihaliea albiluteola]